jgi:hypothetical protein
MPSFLFAKTLQGNIFHSPASIHQRSASIQFMHAERRAHDLICPCEHWERRPAVRFFAFHSTNKIGDELCLPNLMP